MKDHNNNNQVDVTDTLKNMPEDTKKALKDDYEQTKADMENVKEDVKDKLSDDDESPIDTDRRTIL